MRQEYAKFKKFEVLRCIMSFLCIDIGGTNTLLGKGNGEFEVIEKLPTEEFLADIEGTLRDNFGETNFETVGVAAAGPLDKDSGNFYPPNIERESVDVVTPLSRFGDVEIVNDCSAAVIGEYVYGQHETENLVYLTISSGIGLGIVSGGELLTGRDGNFGEIGHMQVRENGMSCGCGGKGHWEAYCSGNNLPRMAEKLTGNKFEDARDIFEKAEKGEKSAVKTLNEMSRINASAVANVVNIMNPDKIIFGGAVALNHSEQVVDALEMEVEKKSVNFMPGLETCSLGAKSVIHGLRAICTNSFNRG